MFCSGCFARSKDLEELIHAVCSQRTWSNIQEAQTAFALAPPWSPPTWRAASRFGTWWRTTSTGIRKRATAAARWSQRSTWHDFWRPRWASLLPVFGNMHLLDAFLVGHPADLTQSNSFRSRENSLCCISIFLTWLAARSQTHKPQYLYLRSEALEWKWLFRHILLILQVIKEQEIFQFFFSFHCTNMAANKKGKKRKNLQNQMFLYNTENVRKWQQKECAWLHFSQKEMLISWKYLYHSGRSVILMS